ncbi:MAG: (2Fe-2S)-binding protein, partial [Algicola sp.]|nr:(2Fe-2S)-binding protein [Algicola sp.]
GLNQLKEVGKPTDAGTACGSCIGDIALALA